MRRYEKFSPRDSQTRELASGSKSSSSPSLRDGGISKFY